MNTQKKANTVQIIAYGTLMTGERNHCFCRNAVSIRPCVVTGTLYDTGYGFPAYMLAGSTQIKAELMEIPMEDWVAMDRLEGYPRLYDRQLCRVRLLDDGSETVGLDLHHEQSAASGENHRLRRLESSRKKAIVEAVMSRPVLIEQSAKNIKLAEIIVLAVLFLCIAGGLGGMYLSLLLGIALFGLAGLAFLAFLIVRVVRWWRHG